MEKLYLPISGINTFQYCQYRFYLVYVCNEWKDNYHTTKGSINHKNVHTRFTKYRKNYKQTRQVKVKSDKLKIVGKIDVVEEKDNLVYPVEFKSSKISDWINNKLQICAQAMCLEEQLQMRINVGYLWFIDSHKRKKIELTKKLKEETRKVIKNAYKILKNGNIPELASKNRCDGCSLYSICLPEERKKLKSNKEG